MKSWILSFIVFLIGTILCKAVEDWTADMFPNPQEEPERCGRSRKSFICDPDHILSQDDANTLDGLIEDVFEKTKAPCAYNGYRIGIALVTKIKATDQLINTSLSTNAIQARQMLNKLSRSRVFATNVKKAWHLGQCGEDVLIIFSVRENVNMMMEQLALVIALLVLCIMACTATEEWSPEEYPDPQKDPGACGRGNVKSFVCDPNGLIPPEDADMLNVIIKEVDFKTKVSCSSHGYRIGIALVKKLKDKSTNTMTGKTEDERVAKQMMRALHLTKKFASETHNRWKLGDCNEDVIITYSQEDDVLYTFAGEEAQRKLTPFIINDITHKANIKDTHISDSLSKMIRNYGAVFNGTYTPSYIQPTFYPQYEPVRSAMTSSAGRPHLYFGVLLAALFDSLFLSRTV